MRSIAALLIVVGLSASCATTAPAFGPDKSVGVIDARPGSTPPTVEQHDRWRREFVRLYPEAAELPTPIAIFRPAVSERGHFIDSWGRRVTGAWSRGWVECARPICLPHEWIHELHYWRRERNDHPGFVWPNPRDETNEAHMVLFIKEPWRP